MIAASIALLAQASAVAAAAQAPTAQVPAVAPAAQPDFSVSPVSPGSWSYSSMAGGSEARFVDTTGTIRLAIRCARPTRRVSISRISTTSSPTLTIWTSSQQRSLGARFEANAYRVTADVAANDSLLDAMAFSRGRFAVSIVGAVPLVVPTWPEAARAIEDCRT